MISVIFVAALLAQDVVPELRVTSEFVKEGSGREILSPALPRNGWTTFHITVSAPPEKQFTLYIGQNPENAARAELYRDGEKTVHPLTTTFPTGKTSEIFVLDLWIDRNAPVDRIKIEPQLWIDSRWIVYPMEARVVEAQVPIAVSSRAATDYTGALRAHWCGNAKSEVPRNLAQDFALATLRPKDQVQQQFSAALGVPIEQWCRDPKITPTNPEWYLKFRDWLLH